MNTITIAMGLEIIESWILLSAHTNDLVFFSVFLLTLIYPGPETEKSAS